MAGWQDAPVVSGAGWESAPVATPAPAAPPRPAPQKTTKGGWGTGAEQAAYEFGGKITDAVSGMGAPAEVAAAAGYLGNFTAGAIPALFSGSAVGKATAPVMDWAAKRLMQSALKPPKSAMLSGEGQAAIQTLLDEGVNVSAGGAAKLQSRIDAIKEKVTQAIMEARGSVDKSRVASRAQDTARRFEDQVNPAADVKAVEDVITAFLTHPQLSGRQAMTVQEAQRLKQGTYERLSKKYGEMGSADVEAQKALARGLKEEISDIVPAVGALNKQQAPLINAGKYVAARDAVAGNKDPVTFALLAGHPLAALGLQASRSELAKSLAARGLYSGQQTLPASTAAVAQALMNREMALQGGQ